MEHTPPTYEEYVNATKFAKTRYKFGVYIQAVAFILLLILLFYTIYNIEEMKTQPLDYAEKKLNIECLCISAEDPLVVGYSNGDGRSFRSIVEE